MRALTAGSALLVLAALASLFATPDVGSSLTPVAQILAAGLLVLAASRFRGGPKSAKAAWALFLVGGWTLVILTAVGTQWPTYKLPWLAGVYGLLPTSRSLPVPGISDGFQPNQMGGLLAFVFAAAAGLAIFGCRRSRLELAGWCASVALAILSLPLIVLTGSRAGLAAAGAGLFVLLLVRVPRLAWLPLAVVAAASFSALLRPGLLTQVAALFLRDETLDTKLVARLDIWRSAFAGIEDHAFTGIGLGVFNDVVPARYPYESVGLSYSVSQAHNVFLDTALTLGLPGLAGLLLLLAGMFTLARQGLAARRTSPGVRPASLGDRPASLGDQVRRRAAGAASLGALAVYVVFGLTDGVSFSSPASLTLWAAAMAVALFSTPAREAGAELAGLRRGLRRLRPGLAGSRRY